MNDNLKIYKRQTAMRLIGYLLYFASAGCWLWTIVEFIIYLFKDHVFNWWSLGLAASFFVLAVVLIFVSAFYRPKPTKKFGVPKSAFMERLEKAGREKP